MKTYLVPLAGIMAFLIFVAYMAFAVQHSDLSFGNFLKGAF